MKTLRPVQNYILTVLMLSTCAMVGRPTAYHRTASPDARKLPRIETKAQMEHSLELFADLDSDIALAPRRRQDQREFILTLVTQSLPKEQRRQAFKIARAVIIEAKRQKMDPLFLLAVISTESKFNMEARGTHGELGLMQILPETGKWLAPLAGLHKRHVNLRDPAVNIRLGAAYFARLRHSFHHHSRRYVAAYNMGATNVRRLLASDTEPEIYPTLVLNNYEQIYQSLSAGRQSKGEIIARK